MKQWWKESVFYQVYPRSFKDSDGDGIGDLKGVICKLDYLKDLGVDVVWLGPINKSSNDDNGYDVSDYYDISNDFGTMEDFDLLLAELHKRDMKLLMDLVVNHTSDEHKWFMEAKKNKENPYRDYYIWRDAINGKEPNNWESIFNGSVWEYNPETEDYYLHLYSKKQPDLNWTNNDVKKEVYNLSKFWLDKGVDGFRLDTITTISKDMNFPDAPIVNKDNKYQPATEYYLNRQKTLDYLHEFQENVLSKYNSVTIGEIQGVSSDHALKYLNEEDGVMDLAFQWEHIEATPGTGEKWDEDFWNLQHFRSVMTKWQNLLEGKGWNTLYLSNHDQPRPVSRFGDDLQYWKESAKMLATCIHMMKGTPFIYQGEEIGMTNVAFDSIEDYRDVETLNMYYDESNKKYSSEELLKKIHEKSRDNARTPMQWGTEENAGFSNSEPWIKVNPNYKNINVAEQERDEESILNYYKKLINLRKNYPVIIWGEYNLILENHLNIYAYTRIYKDEVLLVINNFSSFAQEFNWETSKEFSNVELLISNYNVEDKDYKKIELKPYESRVYLLS